MPPGRPEPTMELKWPKRSHRDVDTYFAGYEKKVTTDPGTGRKKKEYIYRGDYYIFSLAEEGFSRFRLGSLLRVLGSTALFAAAHALGPQGSVTTYIGIPALLSIIPLVYLLMGLVVLLRTPKPKMTIRQYCFGLERMENVLWILLVLWAVAGGGELVYLLVKRLFSAGELLAAGMELGALGLMIWQQVCQSAVLASCIHKPESAEQKKKG